MRRDDADRKAAAAYDEGEHYASRWTGCKTLSRGVKYANGGKAMLVASAAAGRQDVVFDVSPHGARAPAAEQEALHSAPARRCATCADSITVGSRGGPSGPVGLEVSQLEISNAQHRSAGARRQSALSWPNIFRLIHEKQRGQAMSVVK
ncbi:hypothetical protein FVE85_9772 [Porphyridium purpureum]|uniref:Uncharacterized protein n=1 Tax=Porphyridium purpureum TaxID=35688 RepID=A0A5J4YJV8_PORPP|nr:hypothetical protein FVE85_9763 [Porphyridium purpureum]KAA8491719.1 hypothetical protein FVE85_9766 [Porphyridium purpureum]KAA8491722.1 hypothetical protein FVE85_9769 [Porphyridium purpureum]KAA8491725.1 hypothetical protein FVE85_9772 [Porphyridium purpureum]|eukprot:POR1361..scf246_12